MDLLWMKVLGFCYWKKLRMLRYNKCEKISILPHILFIWIYLCIGQKRGTIIYAEFLGGSFTYDAYHMIGPYPEGCWKQNELQIYFYVTNHKSYFSLILFSWLYIHVWLINRCWSYFLHGETFISVWRSRGRCELHKLTCHIKAS